MSLELIHLQSPNLPSYLFVRTWLTGLTSSWDAQQAKLTITVSPIASANCGTVTRIANGRYLTSMVCANVRRIIRPLPLLLLLLLLLIQRKSTAPHVSRPNDTHRSTSFTCLTTWLSKLAWLSSYSAFSTSSAHSAYKPTSPSLPNVRLLTYLPTYPSPFYLYLTYTSRYSVVTYLLTTLLIWPTSRLPSQDLATRVLARTSAGWPRPTRSAASPLPTAQMRFDLRAGGLRELAPNDASVRPIIASLPTE